MNMLKRIIERFSNKRKVYKIELPIGLEISDGDRAAIYGWPDSYIGGTNERNRHDTRK